MITGQAQLAEKNWEVRETSPAESVSSPDGEALLCVALFPANTGYAWDFIEGLYAGVADALAGDGIITWVAYPRIDSAPAPLAGSTARAVELRVRLDEWRCILATLRFIRDNRVRVVYLTDLPAWHPVYLLYRLVGVRRIIAHDHTSGERRLPTGLRRMLKAASRRIPGLLADEILCISEFVKRRKEEADLIPKNRLRRVWNSIALPDPQPDARDRLHTELGIDPHRPVVACVGRAVPEKGFAHLFRAFDQLVAEWPGEAPRPMLVYVGDGPNIEELRALRSRLEAKEDILMAGYRPNAADLVGGAEVCVVPSVWQEGFGLAALEPMARGVPVIASKVGGIGEVVCDGETGLLVPPADEAALAAAMERLLRAPLERRRMGEAGRARARTHFALEAEIAEIAAVLRPGFSGHYAPQHSQRREN